MALTIGNLLDIEYRRMPEPASYKLAPWVVMYWELKRMSKQIGASLGPVIVYDAKQARSWAKAYLEALLSAETAVKEFEVEEQQAKEAAAAALEPLPPGTRIKYRGLDGDVFGIVAAPETYKAEDKQAVWAYFSGSETPAWIGRDKARRA